MSGSSGHGSTGTGSATGTGSRHTANGGDARAGAHEAGPRTPTPDGPPPGTFGPPLPTPRRGEGSPAGSAGNLPAASVSPGLAERQWQGVVDLLRTSGNIHLFAHMSPDGDALGSALAVGLALRELGHQVAVSFGDDPLLVPASIAFLPGQDLLVPAARVPRRPQLAVVFDTAAPDRLGLLREKALAAEHLVVVDHHASNTPFGTHRLVDTTAPATAVLADELIRRLGATLTRDIATAIYTGLATDTGSFKYAATTPATHTLAARLLATGIQQEEISRTLWDTCRFGWMGVLSAALGRAVLNPDAAGGLGLVWTTVTRADRATHGIRIDEIEGVIDIVRRTAEAEVALVLKEDDDGTLRASARAKGHIDLGMVCTALGGGGHAAAAGFTAHGDPADTAAAFTAVLARPEVRRTTKPQQAARRERADAPLAPARADASGGRARRGKTRKHSQG